MKKLWGSKKMKPYEVPKDLTSENIDKMMASLPLGLEPILGVLCGKLMTFSVEQLQALSVISHQLAKIEQKRGDK